MNLKQEVLNQIQFDGSAFDKVDGKVDTAQRRALCWLADTDQRYLSPSDPTLAQRYALAVYYFSLGGESEGNAFVWETNRGERDEDVAGISNWLSSESECDWYQIFCDNNGYVKSRGDSLTLKT